MGDGFLRTRHPCGSRPRPWPRPGHRVCLMLVCCLSLAARCSLLAAPGGGGPGHTGIPSFDPVRVPAATSRIVNQHLACTPFLMCVRQGPSGADDRPAPAPPISIAQCAPAGGRAGCRQISRGRGKREENQPAWQGERCLRWPVVGPLLALLWPFSSWGQTPATPSCLWLAQGPQAA